MTGTGWFSLSGRELLVLALGVGIVLAAVGLTRTVECIWGRGDITITEKEDSLPRPVRLNVNTAEDYELEMLPGIGPKTARAILQYREEHGPFASLKDLARVSGIGPRTIGAIRPHAMCAPVNTSENGATD